MRTGYLQAIVPNFIDDVLITVGEVLFPPASASLFLDELTRAQVTVAGYEGWRYVDREKGIVSEMVGAGAGVDTGPFLYSITNDQVLTLLVNNSYTDIDLIGFLYIDASVYDQIYRLFAEATGSTVDAQL